MTDRPIRPLWPKGYKNETQVICTVLSADLITPHDILCINGASAALMLSPLPFFGPVGAVRVGRIDGVDLGDHAFGLFDDDATAERVVELLVHHLALAQRAVLHDADGGDVGKRLSNVDVGLFHRAELTRHTVFGSAQIPLRTRPTSRRRSRSSG